MLKLFFSQSFFRQFKMSKKLMAHVVWQSIFHYDKNQNAFHNFKNALRVVHSVNFFASNFMSLGRVFGQRCFGGCPHK